MRHHRHDHCMSAPSRPHTRRSLARRRRTCSLVPVAPRVAPLPRLDDLQHAHVPELLQDVRAAERVGLLLEVRLDAPDEAGRRRVDGLRELLDSFFVRCGSSRQALCLQAPQSRHRWHRRIANIQATTLRHQSWKTTSVPCERAPITEPGSCLTTTNSNTQWGRGLAYTTAIVM